MEKEVAGRGGGINLVGQGFEVYATLFRLPVLTDIQQALLACLTAISSLNKSRIYSLSLVKSPPSICALIHSSCWSVIVIVLRVVPISAFKHSFGETRFLGRDLIVFFL